MGPPGLGANRGEWGRNVACSSYFPPRSLPVVRFDVQCEVCEFEVGEDALMHSGEQIPCEARRRGTIRGDL
eukprot:4245376-Alexandrium_andersonii.AAC.1